MSRIFVLSFSLFVGFYGCQKNLNSLSEAKLIGGSLDAENKFSSAIFLYFNNGFSCTGTKVAPGVILTAGHCVVDQENGELYTGGLNYSAEVEVNMQNLVPLSLSRDPVVSDDYKSCIQSSYRCNLAQVADLGIYFVEEKGEFAKIKTTPIDLARLNSGENLISAGYGCESQQSAAAIDKGGSAEPYNIRRKVGNISVVNGYPLYFTARAQENSVQGCPGDSGGPLFQTNSDVTTVVGVLSNGKAYAKTNYVKLSEASQFLRTVISNLTGADVKSSLGSDEDKDGSDFDYNQGENDIHSSSKQHETDHSSTDVTEHFY